jgi:SAM-dependent methyltransferase
VTARAIASTEIERANSSFWDELCGTRFARSLGITDSSAESLGRYDHWYFSFYPYLEWHIPFAELAGKRVLEVGLGYGSVCQRLTESGAIYSGLDIAAGPVEMARHRLAMCGCQGDVRQGSILSAPFADASFDFAVAIGCYHHTGDIGQALRETHRLLVPGGRALIMVYNGFSYRRWLRAPASTLSHLVRARAGRDPSLTVSTRQRAWYDTNAAGEAPPVTQFVSSAELRRLAADFTDVDFTLENAAVPLGPRAWWLATLGRAAGLDLYASLRK